MSTLIIPEKTIESEFRLADMQSDFNSLNNDKLEKNNPIVSGNLEINRWMNPAINFDTGRGRKSGMIWNATSLGDSGLSIFVDDVSVLQLQSNGDVLTKDVDGTWIVLQKQRRGERSVIKSLHIQFSLNELASAGGGTLYINPGTYLIDSTILVPSNVSIIGLGEVIFARNASINCLLRNKADGVTGGYGANKNIRIENITFDGKGTTEDCTLVAIGHAQNISFINCSFVNLSSTWHMLELNAVLKGYVINCSFKNYKGDTEALRLGFMSSSADFPWFAPYDKTVCDNIFIQDSVFSTITGNAIGNSTFAVGTRLYNIHITENKFEAITLACCNLSDVLNLHFENNNIYSVTFGLTLVIKQTASSDIFVEGNFYDGQKRLVDGRGGFAYLSTNGITGIMFVRIKNNTIMNSGKNAIDFTANHVNIMENVITGSRENGVCVYGGENVVISNNYFSGNNIDNNGSADIKLGNNGNFAVSYSKVIENHMDTYYLGANINKLWTINNGIKSSCTTAYAPTTSITSNNIVAGVLKATGI